MVTFPSGCAGLADHERQTDGIDAGGVGAQRPLAAAIDAVSGTLREQRGPAFANDIAGILGPHERAFPYSIHVSVKPHLIGLPFGSNIPKIIRSKIFFF